MLVLLFVLVGVASGEVVGSCGSEKPSKVQDCQNLDMGSCGNACCKLQFTVQEDTATAMKMLNSSLAKGGPDGYFTLQMTAEGTLGFGDLRPYKIEYDFIGQVHHMTSGPMHYNDTIDINIKPQECADQECSGHGSVIKAFSLSLIGGALGDNGQNYKNILMIMKGVQWKAQFGQGAADDSCAPPTVTKATPAEQGSCKNYACDPHHWDSSRPCQCNVACGRYGNCCSDYEQVCGPAPASCEKYGCSDYWDRSKACQCNWGCSDYNNCCPDYWQQCGDASKNSTASLQLV